MKLRMIASDLDGTLLTDKKEILESTEETLAWAAVQGIHFVPATGRAFHSIPEEVLRLPGVEYVITSNGAAVYSMKTGKRIYERLLEPESVEQILELPINRAGESRMWDDTVPVAFEAFIDGIPYASAEYVENPFLYGANEHGAKYVKSTRQPVKDMHAFIYAHREQLDSIGIVCGDVKKKAAIRARLLEHVDGIFVTASVPQLIEIGHQDAGKGKTLEYLMELLGISAEETMCFGDADNDIDMLRAVRYGIAMENATESCKGAAYAVTGSNREDGVGQMIRKQMEDRVD